MVGRCATLLRLQAAAGASASGADTLASPALTACLAVAAADAARCWLGPGSRQPLMSLMAALLAAGRDASIVGIAGSGTVAAACGWLSPLLDAMAQRPAGAGPDDPLPPALALLLQVRLPLRCCSPVNALAISTTAVPDITPRHAYVRLKAAQRDTDMQMNAV